MNINDKKRARANPNKGRIDPNKTKTYVCQEETELLTFLRKRIPSQSQHNIRAMIANSQVAVGGVPVTLFVYKLYPKDEVTVSWTRIHKHPARHDLPIIYEDDDLIAIDKPSGLLSVASDREKGRTAYRLVSEYVASSHRDARIFVIHRIDEDTSGVLVFAKRHEVKEALQEHWNDIVKKRGYYAIVEGANIPESGDLVDYLLTDETTYDVRITKNKAKGKMAVTHFKKMAANEEYALLDVNIDTGRKNQIRVQLGNIGHHVIGDDRYGEPKDPLKRLGLHAYALDFVNPLTNKEYHLNAPMPEAFKRLFWATRAKKRENGAAKQGRRQHGQGISKEK